GLSSGRIVAGNHMISRLSLIVLVAAAFCVPGIQAAEQPSNVAPTEVRLLVDISGSMKQNDPHNLRSPALSLVARMLPDGSRAGVWTFGRMVNALVPLAPVDGAWRERAVSQVGQIRDRKSTRLNSSHVKISYAVFCLKKKLYDLN